MGTKTTYHDMMNGMWGRSGRQKSIKSDAGCQPRDGGVTIQLPKLDKHQRKAAFKLIVAQNKEN